MKKTEGTKAEKIDKTDREILNTIQRQGYCLPKVSKIAKEIGKPSTTVYQRLKRLEASGVIKKYAAHIDAEKVGKPVTAYMLAVAKHGENVDEIAKDLCKIPEVQEVHFITGEWDFLMKIKTRNEAGYYNFSAKNLMENSNLERSMGIRVPKTFKEDDIVEI